MTPRLQLLVACAVRAAAASTCGSCCRNASSDAPLHVGVIGAGFAGLGAAQRLTERGCAVTILEARDRVGGRAETRAVGDHGIDLGPMWLHGVRRHPLRPYVERYGMTLRRSDYDSAIAYNGSRKINSDTVDAWYDAWDASWLDDDVEDSEDSVLREGYGTLAARIAADGNATGAPRAGARGGWSYVKPGTDYPSNHARSRPCSAVGVFAGEYVSKYFGTVHGAWLSGEAAADLAVDGACSGLAKKTCKKTAGCAYKKKTCIPCSELSKKKCKKTDGCDYKKKQCSAASPCSGLSKKKCKKTDGCKYKKKEGQVPRQASAP
ncbi:amine oxidase [Aureococcus anophagefferens]|uniref:Amine oxidase n=1 Tax=Aureococcus anophagefferens TaxID=44056 RepID=A0ABR1FXV5_AURAN